MFTFCFGILSLYTSILLLYQWEDTSTNYDLSAQNYVKCLLLNTVDDPTSGEDACGPHPSTRPPEWRTLTLPIYLSCIGIFCLIIYGTQVCLLQSLPMPV
jgi:hypothetical protein